MHAQYYGAVGAILYNDPADYAPFGIIDSQVYDQKWYMPPSGAQRGSAYTSNGDPLSPIYPSTGERISSFLNKCCCFYFAIEYMYRVKEEDVSFLPKIPAHPISYTEAQVILQ